MLAAGAYSWLPQTRHTYYFGTYPAEDMRVEWTRRRSVSTATVLYVLKCVNDAEGYNTARKTIGLDGDRAARGKDDGVSLSADCMRRRRATCSVRIRQQVN